MSSVAAKRPLGLEFEPSQAAPRRGLLERMLGPRSVPPIPLPPGVEVYAIGDIHGRADLLDRACAFLERQNSDAERRYLVFMGDYVDRGPDSRGVIDRLMRGVEGFQTICLRGNHDQSILNFLGDPAYFKLWKGFGGRETLLSYGVTPPAEDDEESLSKARDAFGDAIPEAHVAFLESLPYFARIGGYLFVHAGFRPGLSIAKQKREDMLWIRNDFLEDRSNFGGIVVYGHTPSPGPVNRPDRIGIDTGAYATGNLTLALFEGGERHFQAVTQDQVTPWE